MEPATIGQVPNLPNPAIQPDQPPPARTSLLPVKPEFYAFFIVALTLIAATVLVAMNKTVPDAMWGIGVAAAGGGLGVMK